MSELPTADFWGDSEPIEHCAMHVTGKTGREEHSPVVTFEPVDSIWRKVFPIDINTPEWRSNTFETNLHAASQKANVNSVAESWVLTAEPSDASPYPRCVPNDGIRVQISDATPIRNNVLMMTPPFRVEDSV